MSFLVKRKGWYVRPYGSLDVSPSPYMLRSIPDVGSLLDPGEQYIYLSNNQRITLFGLFSSVAHQEFSLSFLAHLSAWLFRLSLPSHKKFHLSLSQLFLSLFSLPTQLPSRQLLSPNSNSLILSHQSPDLPSGSSGQTITKPLPVWENLFRRIRFSFTKSQSIVCLTQVVHGWNFHWIHDCLS